ncbi:receptor-type tyrosine-protein phosphatase F-like [Pomacea canaliculata]|uniref:receptor-type tyrosine-protein phosphatase F-like n=1 Tax=Pomacea canaliculata TaxID=400727 RepID=UPI000D73B926|nr:receptor-type tyrosine-protein phosphatase F-like [Pomacea canaliculata]
MYQLQVRAANMWDGFLMWGNFSHEVAVQTNMTAPSGFPSSIRATPLDPFSFRIEWQPVPISQQHGPITGYKLTYWLQSTGIQLGSISCNSSQQTAVIKGLTPWTLFLVTLEAENSKGFGPKSDFFSVKTLPMGKIFSCLVK